LREEAKREMAMILGRNERKREMYGVREEDSAANG